MHIIIQPKISLKLIINNFDIFCFMILSNAFLFMLKVLLITKPKSCKLVEKWIQLMLYKFLLNILDTLFHLYNSNYSNYYKT